MSTDVRFTIHDLEGVARDETKRYEIIDGKLHVSTQPHWRHQVVCSRIDRAFSHWDPESARGILIPAPGVIFSIHEAVAPDLAWVSRERLGFVVGDDGKLHRAPDLVVEVLSPGRENELRDRELKLKVYSRQGVREYWIADWRAPAVQVFRRQDAQLELSATLTAEDTLTSPLLPGFGLALRELFASPI